LTCASTRSWRARTRSCGSSWRAAFWKAGNERRCPDPHRRARGAHHA
jgi:hypothetical protein